MKYGLVLEGGALRGIFTAGVMDVIAEQGIQFPYIVGVSAGSGNMFNFLSGQIGRTKQVLNLPKKETYYGPRAFLKYGHVMYLDKMFFEYPFRQFPFDFDTFFRSLKNTEAEIVLTDCETGKPAYLMDDHDIERLMHIGQASCSVPMLSSPQKIDGRLYLDGSIVDSIPVSRALEKGCDRLVVVQTRRREEPPSDFRKYKFLMNWLYARKYPAFYDACMRRCEMYEAQRDLLKKLEKEGTAFVIHPERGSISRFAGNQEKLDDFYQHGRDVMQAHLPALLDFLGDAASAEAASASVIL